MYECPRRPHPSLPWWAGLVAALLLSLGAPQAPAAIGGDFTLTRTDGSPFALHSLRGQVVVLAFGYTSCPDVCPTTLNTIRVLLHRLGDRAEQVSAVFVSVDPRRDTPEKLRDYLAYFDDSIIGLTGTKAQLQQVAQQYGTFIRYHAARETGAYEVDHSGSIYILDRRGQLSRIIPNGMPPEQLIESVNNLLDEPSPPPSAAHAAGG